MKTKNTFYPNDHQVRGYHGYPYTQGHYGHPYTHQGYYGHPHAQVHSNHPGVPPYGRDPYGHHYPDNQRAPYIPPSGAPQASQGGAGDKSYSSHPDTAVNARLVKGAVIGAAAVYLMTNEKVQQSAIRSMVKIWSLLRGGAEELKERFEDAHAEVLADQE